MQRRAGVCRGISVLSLLALLNSQAVAAPFFMPGTNNGLTVTAAQNVIDQGTPGLSTQDIFYGILNVDNIRAGGSEIWDAQNVAGSPIDSFSGYFVAQVTSVFDAFPASSPYAAAVTLGSSSTDPNGKFSASELAAGSAFKFYVDSGPSATAFESNGSVSDDIAKATDGLLWGTLGFSAASDGAIGVATAPNAHAYWSALILKNGTIFGAGGLDFLVNAAGIDFDVVTDPSCATCGPTDLYFSTVARDNGTRSPWRFGGSSDFTLRPSQVTTVPEPGTLAILSLGGIAFMARRRKPKQLPELPIR